MENWKQIYKAIKIRREDSNVMENFIDLIDDAKKRMYLSMVIDLDPSFENKLRLELFNDFLKVSGLRNG
tara:strand:+ start:1937 stop:2143 length:207 start_codon:yes stop_codon:yes gene_type:complete